MFNRRVISQQKFVSTKDESELKRLQLYRMLFNIAASLTLIIPPLFIGQKGLTALATISNLSFLASTLILLYCFTGIISLYCFINGFFRYALRKETIIGCDSVSSESKRVWPAIKWHFYLSAIFAIIAVIV